MSEIIRRTPIGVRPIAAKPVQRDRLSPHQFAAEPTRYDAMQYRPCGRSGLKLPALSLGAWETFGGYVGHEQARGCLFRAFNLGITHFDLANVYGQPPGRAETVVGRILREMPRDEIVVATKAGFPMWPGPYGEGSSRKSLLANIDQSLQRLELDYVDIFYSHRMDQSTSIEETMSALSQIVRQGKALHVGLSNHSGERLAEAVKAARELKLEPVIVHQVGYSMLRREMEKSILPLARETAMGIVAFSPLAQGLLTTKYLDSVPEESRAAKLWSSTQRDALTPEMREKLRKLNDIGKERGQTLPQMALAWTLRLPEVTSALVGASNIEQIEENVRALDNLTFSDEELRRIDAILQGSRPADGS